MKLHLVLDVDADLGMLEPFDYAYGLVEAYNAHLKSYSIASMRATVLDAHWEEGTQPCHHYRREP